MFQKSCQLCDIAKNIADSDKPHTPMWRMCVAAGNLRYKHTLRICNSYCLSIRTMVARTRLNVTFYVHCLLHTTFFPTSVREWKTRFVEQLEIKTAVKLNPLTLLNEKRRMLPNGTVCSDCINFNTLDDGKNTTKLIGLTVLETVKFVVNCR